MAGIKNIRDLYKKVGEKALREVLEGEIRVTEKFDAYRFAIEKNSHNYKIYFYGKNGKQPLSKIDRTLSDLYEGAVEYIESLPYETRKSLPLRHRFGFSWFPSKNPILTEYERRPKNGLILTDITIRDKNSDVTRELHESEIYQRWANIFNVEYAAPVHTGKLDESTVNYLLQVAKDEEAPQMLTESFETKGYLNTLHPNIEALIFESNDQLFKISQNEEVTKSEKRSHMFDLLLMDILEHVETFNISNIKCASQRIDEAYVEAVSEVFNDYVEKRGNTYLESEMKRPDFLQKAGKFNRKWVKNPKTRTILEKDSRYEYLLSVFLANFRKPKYASGLLNETVVNRFNSKIEEIDKVIGDDYSFLEFSTIVKEEKEEKEENPAPAEGADYVKSIYLLTRLFDPERNVSVGKNPINAIVINGGLMTNRVVQEAERLVMLNKNKCVIIHVKSLRNRSFGPTEETIEKILDKLVEDHSDLFCASYAINKVSFHEMIKKIRPNYEPITVTLDCSTDSVSKEIEGLNAVHTYPKSLMKSIKVSSLKDMSKKFLLHSLENDSYKDFYSCTPTCVHPYWKEIKGAFDRYMYK